MRSFEVLKTYAFHPIILKLNKDYIKQTTDDKSVVKFITNDGDYYILTKNISDAIELRFEQNKKHKHCYERGGSYISKGDVVVDLGAGDGAFTLSAANKAFKVYAFEPHPVYAELLRRSFETTPNVKILEIAASDKQGLGYISDNDFASTVVNERPKEGYTIKLDTLDNILYDETSVDYIKCDIEGEEINMLMGAKKIIKRDTPKIAICVYHHPTHPETIMKLLKEWVPKYKIKIVKNCVLHASIN